MYVFVCEFALCAPVTANYGCIPYKYGHQCVHTHPSPLVFTLILTILTSALLSSLTLHFPVSRFLVTRVFIAHIDSYSIFNVICFNKWIVHRFSASEKKMMAQQNEANWSGEDAIDCACTAICSSNWPYVCAVCGAAGVCGLADKRDKQFIWMTDLFFFSLEKIMHAPIENLSAMI